MKTEEFSKSLTASKRFYIKIESDRGKGLGSVFSKICKKKTE